MTMTTDLPGTTTVLGISGWGVLSPYGLGADGFTAGLYEGRDATVDTVELTDEPVPHARAYALAGFRARDHLGRKGTSFLDRRTAFAVLACRQALADSDLVVDDSNRERVGVVLGTSVGSLQSTSDYSRDTHVQEKPYLVNPILFPNTVLNCAAGQAAIWHGLRGLNTTLAGGGTATLTALRYARTMLGRGRAEALLTGAVEEYTPHMAWAGGPAADGASATAGGEGGAVFLVEDAAAMRAAGRTPSAEVIAVELAHTGATADVTTALADLVRRMLRQAGVAATDLARVVTGGAGDEERALDAAVGRHADRSSATDLVGDCPAAAGALQVAALLAHHRRTPDDGSLSLIVASSADGTVGAALLRGTGHAARSHR
ncbi:beta-ketoacyl synthase N-terminal-like domain-containing protein [Micromonospora sp. C28ISP2-4]|uniref:beta-ketoacyl synthase N-terminal-like domain-containing protein n=1 Tax=Micromonospora sp. C28ISP2-4 TaxID=3059523 RepID=UPI002674F517|nr:beta-ketoacyl synthase N-terminal-like domain-containing protein [Micromonospora sp. C28ISP2-4]MDO3686667.1 beta-ketoacyl synthase N-terminal-like domain-containing protein [Micromonospora sp. C28ISP2-4]